jgi:hypothetical protein
MSISFANLGNQNWKLLKASKQIMEMKFLKKSAVYNQYNKSILVAKNHYKRRRAKSRQHQGKTIMWPKFTQLC